MLFKSEDLNSQMRKFQKYTKHSQIGKNLQLNQKTIHPLNSFLNSAWDSEKQTFAQYMSLEIEKE